MASNFFETWVVNEIYKSFINCGQIPPLSYFRDFNTKEVELLIETDGCVYPLAIRKSAQPVKEIKKFEILKPVAEGEKAVTDKTRAILLGYPNNPTGAIMSKEQIKAIGDWAAKMMHALLAT